MTSHVHSCKIVNRRDSALLSGIRSIYIGSLPSSERKPPTFLAEAVERSDYDLLAMVDGSRVDAFALIYHSHGGEFSLLEYMATAADRRNSGLGSALFGAAVDRCDGRAMLVEVEAVTGTYDSTRERRIAFYRRMGCRRLTRIDYRMPKVSPGEPPPMYLLACGLQGPGVARVRLQSWLEEIFQRVYGVASPRSDLQEVLRYSPEWIKFA